METLTAVLRMMEACGFHTWVSHLLCFGWVLNLECVTLSRLCCPPMKCFISCGSTVNRRRHFFWARLNHGAGRFPRQTSVCRISHRKTRKKWTLLWIFVRKKDHAFYDLWCVWLSVHSNQGEVSFSLYTWQILDIKI